VPVGGGVDPDLRQQAGDVGFDCSFREEQSFCDAGVGAALGHQGEHVAFAWGQCVQRFVGADADQATDDFGVEGGTS